MNARPHSPFSLPLLTVVVAVFLLPLTGRAQGPDDLPGEAQPPPPAPPMDLTQMPLDVTPPPLQPGAQPSPQPSQAPPAAPAASVAPAPTPVPGRYNQQRRQNNNRSVTTAAPSVAAPTAGTPLPAATPAAAGASIRLNFQNASLLDVLNYLSAAAGFIITQETPVTGTVNVVSQQPVTVDEAVDLLSSILSDKGYAVVRNGRILKIVALQDAPKRGDVPVYNTSNPADIPRKDNIVTQILPVRYAEVGKLVDNLRPLLSNNATISSNDSSNAIILTDTQTNIHRLAEIIHALDTSISGISQIKVFTLRYSDAKGLADVITQLFSPQQQGNNPNVPPQFAAFLNRIGGGRGGGGGGGGGGAPANGAPESEARQAAVRVVAVADQTSNSVIVAAPDEVMGEVAAVVQQLDTSTSDITETQIFRLRFADATEMATNLNALYADTGNGTNNNGNNNNGNNNNRGGQQQQNRGPQQNAASGLSARALLQSRVVVVADARTNSVLVSASHDTMSQVALTIGRLDADKSKKQHVFVYTLKHGDPDNVATILRGMYSTTNSTSSSSTLTQPSLSALPTRTQNGASSEITNALSSGTSTNGSR